MRFSASELSMYCAAMLLATMWSATPALSANTFRSGDEFMVTQSGAPLMRGSDTLATLSQGQRLNVLQTEGDWVGTSAIVNGQKVSGWVHLRQVATPAQYAQRRTARRSYSYQPGPAAGAYAYPSRGSSSSRNQPLIMGVTPYGPSYWRADRKITGY